MLVLVFDTQEDCDKFIQIYETYGKTVYYTIKRFIKDEYLIEDISQDIYIKIAECIDKINLNNFKRSQNYIITLVRHYCLNYIRDNSKIQEESLEEFTSLHTNSDAILDKIIYNEDINRLSKEIRNLDEIYKSVLELKYINEFSNAEIASFLNIEKKTVEMRLYRANIMLRNKLGGHTHGK